MPPLNQLSRDAVEVLYVLWMERYNVSFFEEGLTADEITERTNDQSRFTQLSKEAVYAAIKELMERPANWATIAEVTEIKKKMDEPPVGKTPGKRPKRLVLDGDNVSEWPRSCFFLMELNAYDKKRPRQVVAPDFCQHLLDNCGYRHQDDLDEIITGLHLIDYLYVSPVLPTVQKRDEQGRLKERGYLILSLNQRAKSEQAFLRKVALHYPDEVKEDGRTIRHSLFLINDGYYKRKQKQVLEAEDHHD